MKSYHVTSVWFQRIFLHTAQRICLTSKGDGGGGRLNDNIILKGKMKLKRKLEFSKGWKGESPPAPPPPKKKTLFCLQQ